MVENNEKLSGSTGICGDLSGLAGFCRHWWGSLTVGGDLQACAGICLASYSETLCNLVVGPDIFPYSTAISPRQYSLLDLTDYSS